MKTKKKKVKPPPPFKPDEPTTGRAAAREAKPPAAPHTVHKCENGDVRGWFEVMAFTGGHHPRVLAKQPEVLKAAGVDPAWLSEDVLVLATTDTFPAFRMYRDWTRRNGRIEMTGIGLDEWTDFDRPPRPPVEPVRPDASIKPQSYVYPKGGTRVDPMSERDRLFLIKVEQDGRLIPRVVLDRGDVGAYKRALLDGKNPARLLPYLPYDYKVPPQFAFVPKPDKPKGGTTSFSGRLITITEDKAWPTTKQWTIHHVPVAVQAHVKTKKTRTTVFGHRLRGVVRWLGEVHAFSADEVNVLLGNLTLPRLKDDKVVDWLTDGDAADVDRDHGKVLLALGSKPCPRKPDSPAAAPSKAPRTTSPAANGKPRRPAKPSPARGKSTAPAARTASSKAGGKSSHKARH